MTMLGDIKSARELGFNHKQLRRKFVWVACPTCGKERWVAKGEHPRNCRGCHNTILRDYRLSKHPNWKGGKRKSRGYWDIKIPLSDAFYGMVGKNGYVREHRYIMAKYLNRLLSPEEVVHHLNGLRDDNRLRNLAITKHNGHEYQTLLKLAQKRIRELEVKVEV